MIKRLAERNGKSVIKILMILFLSLTTLLPTHADLDTSYKLEIDGSTTANLVAGDGVEISVTISGDAGDTYVLKIPKLQFNISTAPIFNIDSTSDADYHILTYVIAQTSQLVNEKIILTTNHENIANNSTTEILPFVINNGSTVETAKSVLTINFTNPTTYRVQKFSRLLPLQQQVVVDELITYELVVGSTSPKTTLKNVLLTLPVPTGFVLGPSEPGNINNLFSQPNGAGTPLIYDSNISQSLAGNITGHYQSSTPLGVHVAPSAPSLSGTIVGNTHPNVSTIAALSENIGAAEINVMTDFRGYSDTNKLLIDSNLQNVNEKQLAFFIWNQSNITLSNVTANFDLGSGYSIRGIKAPKQTITDGPEIVNRFASGTVFTVRATLANGSVVNETLNFEEYWDIPGADSSPLNRVVNVEISVSSLRPGDGTDTVGHYYGHNIAANAGFTLVGDTISLDANGLPLTEGHVLNSKVNSITHGLSNEILVESVGVSGKKNVHSNFEQFATHLREQTMTVKFDSTDNFLERNEAFSMDYYVFSIEIANNANNGAWIMSNYAGVEGPKMYLVSPLNTKFSGDVENNDFTSMLTLNSSQRARFGNPIMEFVTTLPDGRQVVKIEYSDDVTSPNYKKIDGTIKADNSQGVQNYLDFRVNYVANSDVMYGTSVRLYGLQNQGIMFFGDNIVDIYENLQDKVSDTLDLNGNGLFSDQIVVNGFNTASNTVQNNWRFNSANPLRFSGPNQLIGQNYNRNSGESFKVFDGNTVSTAVQLSPQTTLEGVFRTSLYNGLPGDVSNVTQYLQLPQREFDSLTLQLTGPITPPANTEVLYSTTTQTLTQGSTIDESSFVSELSLNGDFSLVKSILFKVPVLTSQEHKIIDIPFTIVDQEAAQLDTLAVVKTYITAVNTLTSGSLSTHGSDDMAVTFTNPTGSLRLIKTDADDNAVLLEGAEFKINGPNGFTQNLVTNSNGLIELANLELGTYTITEVKAPVGYELNSTPLKVEVDQIVKEVEITNRKQPLQTTGTLTISKVDSVDQDVKLKGAVFVVKGPNEFIQSYTTDVNGQILINNLAYGQYTVEEIKAPIGYVINSNVEVVDINKEFTNLLVTNSKIATDSSSLPKTGINSLNVTYAYLIITLGFVLIIVNKKTNRNKRT